MRPNVVLLIDDHPVVALGFKLALQANERLSLAAALTNPSEGLSAIERLAPDAIVLDLAFDGAVHLSLIRQARVHLPDAVIVVFTSLPAKLYRQDCLAAGANTYLTKDNDLEVLIAILNDLCAKDQLEDKRQFAADKQGKRQSKTAIDRVPPSQIALLGAGAHFTRRESEIAVLLSRGLSVADIASIVGGSENTVAVHRDNVRRKLGCRDSVELVARLARIYAASETHD